MSNLAGGVLPNARSGAKKGASARFNIDDFIEYFNKGFGYTNLFVVYINFDEVSNGRYSLRSLADKTAPGIALACQSAIIPGKTLITKERFTQSVPKQFGYNIQYSDITCNFLVDANISGRNTWNLFNTWMDMIVNPTTAFVGYHDEYSCEMHISMMDHDNDPHNDALGGAGEGGKKIVGIKAEKAFPKALGEISLDAGSTDVAKFSVTFGFHRFFTTSVPDWTKRGAKANKDFDAFDFSTLPASEFAKLQREQQENADTNP
tara:strand:- start:1860 stop:2645 length:786 start_codon:yes stop_codon:yes gene_type:complete